jgi:hypothetical protein
VYIIITVVKHCPLLLYGLNKNDIPCIVNDNIQSSFMVHIKDGNWDRVLRKEGEWRKFIIIKSIHSFKNWKKWKSDRGRRSFVKTKLYLEQFYFGWITSSGKDCIWYLFVYNFEMKFIFLNFVIFHTFQLFYILRSTV